MKEITILTVTRIGENEYTTVWEGTTLILDRDKIKFIESFENTVVQVQDERAIKTIFEDIGYETRSRVMNKWRINERS